MQEDNLETLLVLPPEFPYSQLREIATLLEEADIFVPGYIPPEVGLYEVDGFIHRAWVDSFETILLPDRNIVSRLAQAAKGEQLNGTDSAQRKTCAAILAFSQCLDITIEPSIAFHELAPNQGNTAAHDELAWFRVADNGKPQEWVDVALGLADQVRTVGIPVPNSVGPIDLAKPLSRWRRNYAVLLKIAKLELTQGLSPVDRALALFQWMHSDFIMAGPAAILACVYFAPLNPPRQGLLKSLRSTNREKALAGIRNAAWDITHISDFVKRINEAPIEGNTQFIFTTLDEGLRTIARLVVEENPDDSPSEGLASSLKRWWPDKNAKRVADTLHGYLNRNRPSDWWEPYKGRDYVGELIDQGEREILAYRP
ncbi:hypothetical protein O3299_19850 [Janthinobacterium sp. SUN176]|uniref:hypothetical protein n=1 Tax=Janthinobacterium sp. SUN176 TaxID=3014788 RepID=UPI002712988D|nr:hypothetical protein [Janthinobacterium sp. SUN176]MDO8073793.1 hypothetical protein [Janthinobacterium sp. SUN176]